MTTIFLIQAFTIFLFHWIADFLLQTHEMSINKSKSFYWLTLHVYYYMLGITPIGILLWFFIGFHGWFIAILWVLLNGLLHWITDYNTSRWTSKLWAKGSIHNFFVVIGLDQMIHYICLFATFALFN